MTTGLKNAAIDLEAARRARRHGVRHVRHRQRRSRADARDDHRVDPQLRAARTRPCGPAAGSTPSGPAWPAPRWASSGLGRLGVPVATLAQAFAMSVIAWSPNLTPERAEPARRPGGQQGAAVRRVRRDHHPHAALGDQPVADRCRGTRPDEADGLPDQHLPRADRRRDRARRRLAREADRRRRAGRLRHRAVAASTIRCAGSTTRCCCRTSVTSPPTTTAPGSARWSRTSWPGPTARRCACSDRSALRRAQSIRKRLESA